MVVLACHHENKKKSQDTTVFLEKGIIAKKRFKGRKKATSEEWS